MLIRSTGIWPSSSPSAACARVTASTTIGEPVSVAMARCSRESAIRWLWTSASRTARHDSVSQSRWSPDRRRVAARRAAPGSTTRRKSRASSRAAPVRTGGPSSTAGSSPWPRPAYVTTVPPPRPRRVVTRPESRRAAIASRRVLRETPSRSASSRSAGSCSPATKTPSRMAVASCSTVVSKTLPTAGRSTASGSREGCGCDCSGVMPASMPWKWSACEPLVTRAGSATRGCRRRGRTGCRAGHPGWRW